MPKNVQTTAQLHSSHTLAKQHSKFSKPGFNSMLTENSQMFKLDLERQRHQRSNCQHPLDHRKSKRVPEKHVSAVLTSPKPLTVWITANCGKLLKRWKYQITLPANWKTCMQVKKQQLELDKEKQTGSKLCKEYIMSLYCHIAYLTYMQNTSCEMPGWMKYRLESRLPEEISITSDM